MLHTLFHKNKHNRNIEAHEIDQKLAEQIEKLTEAKIKCVILFILKRHTLDNLFLRLGNTNVQFNFLV